MGNFWAIFGQFLLILANFGQFMGKLELFPWLIGFFLGGRVFVRTVTSDCLADKFGGPIEIATIRLGGWLCGSNRRPLGGGGEAGTQISAIPIGQLIFTATIPYA